MLKMSMFFQKTITTYLIVSCLNYLFGNFFFLVTWELLNQKIGYLFICTLSLFVSSIFSSITHQRFTLRRKEQYRGFSFVYVSLQLLGFTISLFLVPTISEETAWYLPAVQFAWSFVFSILVLALVKMIKL